MTDTFPILKGQYLKAVPWDFMAPHAVQAKDNHDQTLERLAERGGLSPHEALCVIRRVGIFCEWPVEPEGLLIRYLARHLKVSVSGE